jgi:DNA-binding transcriptional ArsR family regulator
MEDLSKYYTLLRDPTRRRIIEILAVQEKIGFKELRETLGLGVGTVYYHLDMLSGFGCKISSGSIALTSADKCCTES